ncbi:MAG: hypothetical protein LBS51_03380 [Oscillospiraceae bacterium]|jgi:hypothetical protein|nr:hypothetical protein [Oscillospiraceae bacterium]
MKSADTGGNSYIESMHRLGRAGMLGAIAVMLGLPTILGICFGQLPRLVVIFRAALPLLIIFVPSSLFEVISYTPILGSSIYLTLITGEVLNLKLPVVNNALKLMNVEQGSEESDVVSSIAVCTATFVTIAVVSVGVLLATPFQSLLAAPAVRTASANILPALFGSLVINALGGPLGGGVTVEGRAKNALLPIALVALITLFDRQISVFLRLDRLLGAEGAGVIMTYLQGFVVIATMPVTYFCTKWLYGKNHIRVRLPDDAAK